MPGWDGPGWNPLDTPGTGTTGRSGYTSWDLGGGNCRSCFGGSVPATNLTITASIGPLVSPATLVFLGSNTSVTWAGTGATSGVGLCWQVSWNIATGLGPVASEFQLVCTGSCTACALKFPFINPNNGYCYTDPLSCDNPCGAAYGTFVVGPVIFSPLSITLQALSSVKLVITP